MEPGNTAMKDHYPNNVINKILKITLKTHTFAYLAIDNQGVLLDQGGDMLSLGLPSWNIGDNVLDQALFLSGFLPMASDYEYIPSFATSDSIIVDIHLFQDNETSWAVLVDKTEDMEWQARARQKTNELRLLQQKMEEQTQESESGFKFFEALNMMALERKEDGSFELIPPVSDRFNHFYPEPSNSSAPLYPQHKFTFIENFMVDATQLWDSGVNRQRIYSGPWIEKMDDGDEIALEASAITWDGHKLLFIQILDEIYRQHHECLQIGREGVLLKNLLELEVRKRTEDIRAREEEIALRLVCAADTRDDGETGSHIRRLGLYSELMATHLGWDQESIDEIRIAAPMHDIGKIGIPDSILKKPGKLSPEEYIIMQTHPQIGANILSNSRSSLVQMAKSISMGHHEKWDGSGYPQGLSGEDIAISARIVAIVDVFDALIHKRVYKDKISVDRAIEIMTKGRGTHFDPKLFDLFVQLKAEMEQISLNFDDPLCST